MSENLSIDEDINRFDNLVEAVADVLESMDGMDIADVARAVVERVAEFNDRQGK